MSRELTTHEIEALRMLNGEIPAEWGAWVGECCEFLKARGLAKGNYEITDAGRCALRNQRERKAGNG